MQILYIHPVAIPSAEANTIQAMRMCEAFAANGHTVKLLAPASSRDLQQDVHEFYGVANTFSVTRNLSYSGRGRTFLFALKSALTAALRNFELVYTRDPVVANFCTSLHIPTIVEIHSRPAGFSRRSFTAFGRAIRRPETLRVVAISEALRRALLDDFPSITTPLVVAHDGAVAGPERVATPSAKEGEFLALYAGHLYAGKGIDLLIAAARLTPEVKVEIVGGAARDIEHWQSVAVDVPSVRFAGFLRPASVSDRLANADAVVAPYQRKVVGADRKTDISAYMSPLKIFEYMAAGRAIIASDLPVIREVLTHGETALLCPPDDPVAWSNALRLLKDDPELRLRLGRNARALLEREFTWKRRAERVLDGLG